METQWCVTGRLVFFLFFLLFFNSVAAADQKIDAKTIRIGVLATRGVENCLKSWSPTADYLSRHIPGFKFVVVPLGHDTITSTVRDGKVDFILTNSSFYVELEQQYGANRIATLKEMRLGQVFSKYGSAIFCRADRTDIRKLADLKGHTFMGVSEGSLGGWQMAWRELQENGINPFRHFKELRFGQTHDEVVYAVRDGEVDAGSVRTNTLEALSAEGKINLNDFYVLPRIHDPELKTPYLCTTREYPDWPMAKAKATPDELAEKVAIALLQMQPDAEEAVAAGCAGWTIPLNYQPVMELMMTLRLGPYKELGRVTIRDIVRNYRSWLIVGFIIFCSHLIFTALIMKLNRRIKTSQISLLQEIEQHHKADLELENAKKQAEAATLAKSQFLANMSHEIRTPMNGIVAATELALAETLTPEVEEYLHIVQNSSSALLGIINDILDFSKIEAGQLELRERLFRLDEMLDRVMDVFINQAGEKGIELLVDIDRTTPRILLGDSLRLQQILINLIGNSIKFTGSNGMILISVREAGDKNQSLVKDQIMLEFSVKDNGSGISQDYMPLLFEPFTQGDSSSTRKFEGTGLGLSICKKFVTMMHGTIGVESVLGEGATFTFTVRLIRASDTTVSRCVFPPDIRGLKVLVVDDSADSREIMTRMLTSLDFRVESLSSGGEAIARLEHDEGSAYEAVDLILMDWKMPGLDGIETSRRVREELKLSMPIIMMTAFAREVHKSEAQRVGTNGFLTKPIFQSTLFDVIMDAFGKEGVRRSGTKKDFSTRASMYKKHLKGCRVLVVEDNLTNQQVAKAILAGAGINVIIAGNGEEAVETMKKEAFDAVLMDVQMPKMNGFEATRLIRKLPGGDVLPIIAMTAHALKGDEEKCLEAGMDGYVAKPISQDRLFYTLWRLLRSRKRVMAAETGTPAVDSHSSAEENDQLLSTDYRGALLLSEKEDPTSIPFLPGIDVSSVLQTTGLDWQTYQEVLLGFIRDNQNTAATVLEAYTKNDLESVKQCAHSLKGSAANIGAGELHSAAGALEACWSDGNHDTETVFTLIGKVADELARLLTLHERLAGTAAQGLSTAMPSPAGDDFKERLTGLAEAIDRADPEEIRTKTTTVLRLLQGQEIVKPALLRELETQTRRYDYDQALKTIEYIRNALEKQQ